MRPVLDQRDSGVDIALFIFTLLGALVVQAVASRWYSGMAIFLNLPLIALFIWSVRRPYWVSPPVLLIVGLFQDLFLGTPLGLWAIAYVIAFSVLRDREADGAGGEIGPLSLRFAALAAATFFCAWLAGSAAIGAPAGFQALIGEGFLTILLFPVFAWAFARRKERGTYF